MSWGTFWLSIITPKKSQRPFKEKEKCFQKPTGIQSKNKETA